MVLSNSVRFWLYLIPLIPSIIVTIFNLYYLRSRRAFGKSLKNHDTFLLLTCMLVGELSEIIWDIDFYRTDSALSSTPAFCLIWTFISSTISVSIYILIAWASIERNIITFHPNWLSTKRKRLLLHYLPLSGCILWPMIFYFCMFFIMSCDVSYNYNTILCDRYDCIINNHFIAIFDSIMHFIIPVCITIVFSSTLLVRVIYHRYRIHQRIDWNPYRRLAVQVLPISMFYIVFQLPPVILYTAYSVSLSRNMADNYYSDSLYFRSWIILFTPFILAVLLPELQKKYRKLFIYRRRKRIIHPMVIEITPPDLRPLH